MDRSRARVVEMADRQAHDNNNVVLVDGETVCDIVVADSENSAVKQAATFLAGDIEKISGKRPEIVSKRRDHVSIELYTAPSDQNNTKWAHSFSSGAWEAYEIKTSQKEVVLCGSDFRGTAFAAYTLSERLGVDPLHCWTCYEPEHHNPLVLKGTNYSSGEPTFRYRGMFHDDEDILPRPFENAGYPLRTGDVPTEWYARYFETALRLRMNFMVAPYTRVHRRYEVQKMASDWGLFYTSHHYDVLLSNPFGIERYGLGKERNFTGAWDWINNRDVMIRYWQGGLDENKDLNCIWPVGMRGTDDYGYKFPPGTTDQQQARVFKEAIAQQVKMTTETLPKDKQPIFHFTLYTEMLEKYQSGKLDVPGNVIIVWPDDNDGTMRGLPEKKDRWKHGVYYHLAYLGKQVKQSVHMVQPQRVAEQFKKVVDSGATEYMLVNVSELREFVMEARMLADICWDAKTALAGDDPAKRYVNWWCREYFGDDAAPAAAKAYGDYEHVFDSYDKQWFGSEKVHDLLAVLSKRMGGKTVPTTLPADLRDQLRKRSVEMNVAMNDIADAANKMNWRQQQFFFDHVALPVLFDARPTQTALQLLDAVDDPNKTAVLIRAHAAIGDVEQLELDILRGEHPPFEHWYRETWIRREPKTWNVHRPYEEMELSCRRMGSSSCKSTPSLPTTLLRQRKRRGNEQ